MKGKRVAWCAGTVGGVGVQWGNKERSSKRRSGRLEYRSEENLVGCTEVIRHPFWIGYNVTADVANDTGADFNNAKGSAVTGHQTVYEETS